MGLSVLGIFHTAIGIIAIAAALLSFAKFGRINLAAVSGKVYFWFTAVTSLTALGLSKKGGFNPGHVFSLFILVLICIAFFLHHKRGESKRARYVENFLLSFSFFLSMVPTVNETLTRIPLGMPIAKAPGDPIIAKVLLTFLVLFIAGSVYQFIKQRQLNKAS